METLEVIRWVNSKDPEFTQYLKEISPPLAQTALIAALLTEGLQASHQSLLTALESIRS